MNKIHGPYGPAFDLDDILSCVGPGWETIVRNLITRLFELGWDGKLNQIKEKYGTLRFYIGSETPEMAEAIDEAEKQSGLTCDTCGSPGALRNLNGWYVTRCDNCV